MTIDLTRLTANTQTWAQSTSTADVSVTLNGTARTLTGTAAAAYLFGQALTTVKFKEDTVPDGLQLNDGTFQFPPGSTQWVSLGEVADALRYKYGVDPLIEFAPGLGVRGYSVADINRVLELLNREFADSFKLSLLDSVAVAADPSRFVGYSGGSIPTGAATLLNTASTPILAAATDTELRQSLTEGGDLYTDRFGAFYLNGVRTQAMDVAVTSRLLVQDNVSAEYKLLMDELAERNNLIAVARSVIGSAQTNLPETAYSLGEQYGMTDVLSELTAGQYTDAVVGLYRPNSTDTTAGKVVFSLAADPSWPSGTRVTAAKTAGGLTAGTNYFVLKLTNPGEYSFASTSGGSAIPLTGAIGGLRIPETTVVPSNTYNNVVSVSSTDTANDKVTFTSTYFGLSTGTRVRVGADGGGLFSGKDYYVSVSSHSGPTTILFYDTAANALAGGTSGRVDLTGNITTAISAAGSIAFNSPSSPDPGWPSGTRVKASLTGGGLTAGTEYFVRNLGAGSYSFFDTAANAKNTNDPLTGLVILTASITASITNPPPSEADFTSITALLNTLISNKVRDGDLDQAKLQTLTAQLQNNTEAMTALIKAFSEMNRQLAQALR